MGYIYIYIYKYTYPKTLQFVAYGQLVLVFIKSTCICYIRLKASDRPNFSLRHADLLTEWFNSILRDSFIVSKKVFCLT